MGRSFYATVNEFTADLAASLIVGTRLAPANQQHFVADVLRKLKDAYQVALDYYQDIDATSPLRDKDTWTLRDRTGLSPAAILSCDMQHGERQLVKNPASQSLAAWLANQTNQPTAFERQVFDRAELHRWLHAVGLPTDYGFAARNPIDTRTEYVSLSRLVEPYVALSLNELPEAVRERVEEADNFQLWDKFQGELQLSQRRKLANDHDYMHDPAAKPLHEYWDRLSDAVQQAESTKHEWDLRHPQSIIELKMKEDRLAAIDGRLRNLLALWKMPPFSIQNWDVLTDEVLAEVIDAAPVSAPALPAKAAPVESVKQRRHRLLQWLTEEELIAKRGALARVFEREKKKNPRVDRSNLGKDIAKARTAIAMEKKAGSWTSQLVQDGKRTG